MPPKADNTVMIEGAQIIFRNFEGREDQYNPPGHRSFGVLLDPELAKTMAADGWNVKALRPREDDEEQVEKPWLPVAIRFDVFPPHVVMLTSRGRQNLDDDTIGSLDWANIINVDLIVRPFEWELRDGRTGIKAYVKTMFVTIEEDPLQVKYSETDKAAH
jgi:hypothetical protein